ncbi:hypothetical protein HDU76_007912, partial [Blyttiomyces sp. JEL0837]
MYATSNIITGTAFGISTVSAHYIAAVFIFGPVKSLGMILIYYGSILTVEYRERTRYDMILKTFLLEHVLSPDTFVNKVWKNSGFQFHRKDIAAILYVGSQEKSDAKLGGYENIGSFMTFHTTESCGDNHHHPREESKSQFLVSVNTTDNGFETQVIKNHDLTALEPNVKEPVSFWTLFRQDLVNLFWRRATPVPNKKISPNANNDVQSESLQLPVYHQDKIHANPAPPQVKPSSTYCFAKFCKTVGWAADPTTSDPGFQTWRWNQIVTETRFYLAKFAFFGCCNAILDSILYCNSFSTYTPQAICGSSSFLGILASPQNDDSSLILTTYECEILLTLSTLSLIDANVFVIIADIAFIGSIGYMAFAGLEQFILPL